MYAIHRFGTEEQKQRWLPEMAAGRALGCFGLTEPGHGSDPAGMETRADKDGGHWVLTGRKLWITNAQVAHLAIVWARTADGIRGFIVERGQFASEDIPHKLSMRASMTGGLVFDGARIPEENRLPCAAGLKAPLWCLASGRFGVARGVLDAARACLEIAIDCAQQRTQLGGPIAAQQLIPLQLADVATGVVH